MTDNDTMKQHLLELRQEHRELDDSIAELLGGSPEDQIDIQRMKKRKLHLKDEISNLESALLPDIIA
jgi:hypothetical protein